MNFLIFSIIPKFIQECFLSMFNVCIMNNDLYQLINQDL